MRELLNGLVNLIDVSNDASVIVWMLGLARIGVVVVEIWGEIFPVGEFRVRSPRGGWYGVPRSHGMVL